MTVAVGSGTHEITARYAMSAGSQPIGSTPRLAGSDRDDADLSARRAVGLEAGEPELLAVGGCSQTVHGTGIDRPAGFGLRHQERRRSGFDGAVEEHTVAEATRVDGIDARPLTLHRAFQTGPHGSDHRAIVGLVADGLEDLDHRRRERAPVFVADDQLLRQLR